MSEYETLLVEHEDGVVILTLNRPEVLNAMNTQLNGELHPRSRQPLQIKMSVHCHYRVR